MWEQIAHAGLAVALSILGSALVAAALFVWRVRAIRRAMRQEIVTAGLQGATEARREAEAIAKTLEAYKAERVQADQEIAAVLARTTQAYQEVLAVMTHKLDQIAFSVDKGDIALQRIERTQANQAKLFTARAMTAAAIVALQTSKGLAEKELAVERAKHTPQE